MSRSVLASRLNLNDKVGTIDTYRFQLEMSELVTIERMGYRLDAVGRTVAKILGQAINFLSRSR